ncbi:MAG: exopolysaccharide biosynthesis polyprenyl glycosylphosphotransferase [Oscillospiraceae bacterium]|nr:exopolysaccharide biosynthesis polyprenyl glycosylphosphotransferase [Oscillospiraceae bacterium]
MTREFKHDALLRVVKLLNVALVAIPFLFIWVTYYNDKVYPYPYGIRSLTGFFFLFCVLYYVFGRIYDAFKVSLYRISEMAYSQVLSCFFADAMMYIVTALVTRKVPNLFPFLAILGCQSVLTTIWAFCAHKWYFSVFSPQKTMIIYDMREGMEQLISDYSLAGKFEVLSSLHIDDALKNDLEEIRKTRPAVIFMCGVHSKERNVILKYCVAEDILVYLIPRVGDVIMSSAWKMHMFHLPMLRVGRYRPNPEVVFLKRLIDIFGSAAGMLVLSPIFLVTAMAIKAEDGGPIFYRQKRLTKDGKIFEVLKFRSMWTDAEKDGVARLSTGDNDDRITKVGRIIRKIRIDELPQLINILRGDMSIVGPRPERPEIAEEYEKIMPEFSLRLQAKAGLTGYAQVYGKYNTTPYDKLQMDLMYIANPNLFEDFRIIFATIKILFLPESTEGVAAGQTTAMDYENAVESADYTEETTAK